MKTNDRIELIKWVIQRAQKEGAGQVAASLTRSRSLDIEARDSQLDKLQQSTQQALELTLYVDGRYSVNTTSNLQRTELERFIAETTAMTRYLASDPDRSLPDPKFYQGRETMELEIRDVKGPSLPLKTKIDLTRALEAETHRLDQRLISVTASFGEYGNEKFLMHSNGFFDQSDSTLYSLGAQVSIKDDKGRPEDYALATVRFWRDLPQIGTLAEDAVQRVIAKIGQQKMPTGNYELLVENRTAARLLYMFVRPLTARALQQKSSCLEGRLDQKIVSEKLTVSDDPFLKRGLGSRHFDGEGLSCRRRTLIEKGVLKAYLIDNYYGRKLGLEPNGGTMSNVVLAYGERNTTEMKRQMKKGLLVTAFIGGNSNPTTGDFSMGLMGLYLEDGKVVKGFNEMNLSGNLFQFWSNLAEVGNDAYPYSSWRLPTLRFQEIQISGL